MDVVQLDKDVQAGSVSPAQLLEIIRQQQTIRRLQADVEQPRYAASTRRVDRTPKTVLHLPNIPNRNQRRYRGSQRNRRKRLSPVVRSRQQVGSSVIR